MEKQKTFKNKIVIGGIAAALISTGVVGTMALLSSTATTEINITSATFEVTVNDEVTGVGTGDYQIDIDVENMAPGETRSGDITIVNESSIPVVITSTLSELDEFDAVLSEGATTFTSSVFTAGESRDLTLSVSLDENVTEVVSNENLQITFNAEQE